MQPAQSIYESKIMILDKNCLGLPPGVCFPPSYDRFSTFQPYPQEGCATSWQRIKF